MLSIKKVTKTFGDVVALKDVSLEVKDKEFVFLTGPSGAGKTTLLRLVLGELKPDSGEILLSGQSITALKPYQLPFLRQQIGMVFQDFKILPERTIRENIEIALAIIRLPEKQWNEQVDSVLKLVSLNSHADQFPSQLSGGELQRVALARALVVNPKLIIADEPTGNLDWETAEQIMEIFEKIHKEGKTVIVASHHKAIMKKMGKRIIELKEGKII